jgi:hypothetical protein
MKLRQQALSAVAATALLAGISGILILSGGTRSSLAETISAEALTVFTAATSQPGAELKAQLDRMDQVSPGASQQFVAAVRSAQDTDGLAASLQALATQQAGLQSTIDSALTALAKDPKVAGAAGGPVAPAALVSATQGSLNVRLSGSPATQPTSTNASNGNADIGNLVPAAAPNPAAPANPVAPNALPRSVSFSPASTQAFSQGVGNANPPTSVVSFTGAAGGGVNLTVTTPGPQNSR